MLGNKICPLLVTCVVTDFVFTPFADKTKVTVDEGVNSELGESSKYPYFNFVMSIALLFCSASAVFAAIHVDSVRF